MNPTVPTPAHAWLLRQSMRRRLLIATSIAPLGWAWPVAADERYAAVVPRPLVFPADHGAHPAYRIEWWYLTAVLSRASSSAATVAAAQDAVGIQVTFFRVRTPVDVEHPQHPSRFAARQLLIAHAAVADPRRGSLLHEQRIARVGPGGTSFDVADTALTLGRWRLQRADAPPAPLPQQSPSRSPAPSSSPAPSPTPASGPRQTRSIYTCDLPGRSFTLRFTATAHAPLLLQGEAGTLRKLSHAGSRDRTDDSPASHYYSWPQLVIDAQVEREGRTERLTGTGWLDHEWLSTLLGADGAGWDWTGMNLDDGGALMAYNFRRRDGTALHASATLRDAAGTVRKFGPDAVVFTPIEHWTSPRTRGRYPIAMRIRVGERTFETRPLMADQELDSRTTTGQVYWEGASTLFENGRGAGRGYVELTGYAAPMNL